MNRITKTFASRLVAAAFGVAMMIPAASQASLVWDYSIDGGGMMGGGQISFATDSGSGVAGVEDFSWAGTTGGETWACAGAGCLAQATWSIDSNDWSLDYLGFITNAISNGGPNSGESTLGYGDGVTLPGPFMIGLNGAGFVNTEAFSTPIGTLRFPTGGGLTGGGNTSSTPVHDVPAPGTLALLGLGLAGLAFRVRKTKK